MDNEDKIIKEFKGKKYRTIEFVSKNSKDKACNHCAFELGKCKIAIMALGQCYIEEYDEIVRDVYYQEVKESK